MPDDPEPNYDDEEKPKNRSSGSMFDRVSEPKKDAGSLFSNGNAPKFSFGGANGNPSSTSNVFGSANSSTTSSTTSTNSGVFGSASSSSSNLFGASSAPKPAASAPAADGEEAESGEPSDSVPPPKAESDLSKQGPGEEDEDNVLQCKTIFYAIATGSALKKEGAGVLRVLRNRVTNKGRVVVRTDVGKVLLNVGLVADVTYVLQDNGLLRLPQFKEDGTVDKTWGIKVKDKDALKDAVDEAKKA